MAINHRITIGQIAKEAGVSKQTVSRVLNNRPDVAPQTRQRVQDIIDRKGYQPSKLARGLTQGRTYTIGVIASDLRQFGPSQTLTGIDEEARALGYTLTLGLIQESGVVHVRSILGNMLAQHVDGLIWAAVGRTDENYHRTLEDLAELPIPVVISAEPRPGLTAVHSDNRLGGRMAAQHLLQQGYCRVGIITGPLNEWSARQRLAGWQEALRSAGLSPDDALIAYGNWTAVSGDRGLRQLLQSRPDIDAVFVSNDQMAVGVLKAAQDLKRQIPDDLGVVGYDDIPEASYFTPSLTTIRQDLVKVGRLSLQQLDRQIIASHQNRPCEPQTIEISPELVIRASAQARAKAAGQKEVLSSR